MCEMEYYTNAIVHHVGMSLNVKQDKVCLIGCLYDCFLMSL